MTYKFEFIGSQLLVQKRLLASGDAVLFKIGTT